MQEIFDLIGFLSVVALATSPAAGIAGFLIAAIIAYSEHHNALPMGPLRKRLFFSYMIPLIFISFLPIALNEFALRSVDSPFAWLMFKLLLIAVCIYGALYMYNNFSRAVDDVMSIDVWLFWKKKHEAEIAALPVDPPNLLYLTAEMTGQLRLPKGIKDILSLAYFKWLATLKLPCQKNIEEMFNAATPEERANLFRTVSPSSHAEGLNKLMELVPALGLVQAGDVNLFDEYLRPTLLKAMDDDHAHAYYIAMYGLGDFADAFKQVTISHKMPEAMRVEHQQVIGNPGHGKSSLIAKMIVEDIAGDAAVVVIDSQGDLINELAVRVPRDRLILVDPETCPPAMNIFAQKFEGEREVNNALALFEYIFASLGVNMTGKQEMVYRYLSRLCMALPNSSIETLRDMLLPQGTEAHQETINTLGDNARAFFIQFQQAKNNQFSDTRQEVLLRLLKVLETETFAKMLAAKSMKLDIPAAIEDGKIILVSTSKNLLDKGSALFGRIFVSQVMQSVRNRPQGHRRRVYLYIDEFADYAEDSNVLLDCFQQGRKYELGMIVCHQNLSQLTPRLAATISSSTAIKFAGGLSAEDARTMTSQMRAERHAIDSCGKGTFLAYFKDIGTIRWPVKFGYLKTLPVVSNLADIQQEMRDRYGEEYVAPTSNPLEGITSLEPEEGDRW